MANLSGLKIKDNRKGILNLGTVVNTPLSATLQAITDGVGNASPLQVSTEKVCILGTTLTGSSAGNLFEIIQTWNTTGNPIAHFMNITNTASGASSMLADWRIGNVTQFSVSRIGTVNINGALLLGNRVQVGSAFDLAWNNRSRIFSDANGNIRFANSSLSDFGLLQFGGLTNAFPAIKRSGANLQVRLSDDTGFSFVEDLYRRAGSGSPEGVVTAPIGATYSRTDGGAGTAFYVKESGTGNTGWVGK